MAKKSLDELFNNSKLMSFLDFDDTELTFYPPLKGDLALKKLTEEALYSSKAEDKLQAINAKLVIK